MKPVLVEVTLEQKHPGLAAFVVVPQARVAAWKLAATTTVEATLDGKPLGRRSLKRWDERRWFLELRRDHLAAVGKSCGERATLRLSIASTDLPAELEQLLGTVPAARARWRALTGPQQRMLREEILAARSAATRDRRARRALCPPPTPAPARVPGLSAGPRSLLVRIVGRRLPGTSCGPYSEVRVGLAHKVGCDPADTVPADRTEAVWETRVEVRDVNGRPAFRGSAVNGPPGERFLYLTWIGRKASESRAGMFRRAKLRLDCVPAEVLARALRSGQLVARLELTARDGMPVCASVRPPAVSWSAPGA